MSTSQETGETARGVVGGSWEAGAGLWPTLHRAVYVLRMMVRVNSHEVMSISVAGYAAPIVFS